VVPRLNLNVSVLSLLVFDKACDKEKFIGPSIENQSTPKPIELLILLEVSMDES
jgi:hypothetical protein